jgi:hypothetical protein
MAHAEGGRGRGRGRALGGRASTGGRGQRGGRGAYLSRFALRSRLSPLFLSHAPQRQGRANGAERGGEGRAPLLRRACKVGVLALFARVANWGGEGTPWGPRSHGGTRGRGQGRGGGIPPRAPFARRGERGGSFPLCGCCATPRSCVNGGGA